MSGPHWSPVDDPTADLLALVADTDHPSVSYEWDLFVAALSHVAGEHRGLVDQNHVRPLIRGQIAPKRIGSFYRKACTIGLLAVDDYSISDDVKGRNHGRPMRTYRLNREVLAA